MKQRNLFLLMILIGVMVFLPLNVLADIGPPITGQTLCYDDAGAVIACAGTGQDGELQLGVSWATGARFTRPDGVTIPPVPGDGAVYDSLTNLMWLQSGNTLGSATWPSTLNNIWNLNTNTCWISAIGCGGLTAAASDAICTAGPGGVNDFCMDHWRMPSYREMETIYHYGYNEEDCSGSGGGNPCANNAQWLINEGFTNVINGYYWTGTAYANANNSPSAMNMANGYMYMHNNNADGGNRNGPLPRYGIAVRGNAASGLGAVDVWESGDYRCWNSSGTGDATCTSWNRMVLQEAYFAKAIGQPPGPVNVPAYPPIGTRFLNHYNGTITDTYSGLMWTSSGLLHKDENPATPNLTNLQDVYNWVANMDLGLHENFGYRTDAACPLCEGWRVPNRREMFSIMAAGDTTGYENKYLYARGFDAGKLPHNGGYWTSTSVTNDPTRVYGDTYWHLSGLRAKVGGGAYFHPVREAANPPFGLGVKINPAAAGSVVSIGGNAGDINCPPDCSETWFAGDPSVELVATAFLGSIIDPVTPWTGCDDEVTNAPNCLMNVGSANKGVQANFVVPPIIFDPLTLDFGDVGVGETIQRTLRVYNYDVAPFTIDTFNLPGAPFTVVGGTCNPPGGTIIPIATAASFTMQPVGDDDPNTITQTFGNGRCNTPSNKGCFNDGQCGWQASRTCTNPAPTYPNLPINPGSVTLNFQLRGWGWIAVQDDGFGHFLHDNIGYHTFNYTTGQMQFRLKSPPQQSSWVSIDYAYGGIPSCTLDVQFSPVAQGDFVDSVLVQGLKPVALYGTGIAPTGAAPRMQLSKDYVSMMNTALTNTNTDTVTVSNIGGADLVISSITGVPAPFGMDYVTGCGALPITLPSATSCDIAVSYKALTTVFGPNFDSFMITSNDSESPSYVGLGGSAIDTSYNTPPTKPVLISPVNGDYAPVAPDFNYLKGEDFQVCISDDNPKDCDPLQRLSNVLYVSTDPAFDGVVMPMIASMDRGTSYAMVFGNPVFLIALFGIVAVGVFLRRKKIVVLLVAVVLVTGLLFVACGGDGSGVNEQRTPSIGGSGGGGAVTLQAGQTYWWKVIACDGAGGCTESEIWSFIVQ